MTSTRLSAAIISTAWAIVPEALEAIIAIVERRLDDPAYLRMREKAIEDGKWPPQPDALLLPGAVRMEGAPGGTYRRESVAIIPIIGPIIPHASMFSDISGAVSVDSITASIRAAAANPDIKTIALVYDSPGGAVPGIRDLAERIATQAATDKKVEAFIYGYGASAAYWLASASSTITLAKTAAVGSIGVAAVAKVQQANDQNGERRVEIVSSNAPNKRPDLSTPEGIASIRSMLDQVEAVFVGDVATYRKVTKEKVLADFGKGGSLIGDQAVAAGMADGVMTFDAWIDGLVARSPRPAQPVRRIAAEAFLTEALASS
jgi:ClpP class serine protease